MLFILQFLESMTFQNGDPFNASFEHLSDLGIRGKTEKRSMIEGTKDEIPRG